MMKAPTDHLSVEPDRSHADVGSSVESEHLPCAELIDSTSDGAKAAGRRRRPFLSLIKQVLTMGLVLIVAMSGLAGWWGYRWYEAQQYAETQERYLQIGRQGAIDLTTIDFQTADADVERILDSATGVFYEDFSARSASFVDLVKQTQSTTRGTVIGAGIESATDNGAQILVAVKVQTSNAAAAEQEPRSWRMRVSVQRMNDRIKVSNVEFVP
jgi:Mce-associated membrane protein